MKKALLFPLNYVLEDIRIMVIFLQGDTTFWVHRKHPAVVFLRWILFAMVVAAIGGAVSRWV